MVKERSINVAVIGGGYAANLLGAMDRVDGFAVQSVGYANRSGRHGTAIGRDGRDVAWGRAFSGPDLGDNITRLLNQDKRPDVVLLALPPHLTPDATRVVLNNTPPETAVHIEKPVALKPADIVDIADTIRDTGRVVRVGHQWVFNPPYDLFEDYVRTRLDQGQEPSRVQARWHGDTFYKAGSWWRELDKSGGPLKEQGHPGHLAQRVVGGHLGELQVAEAYAYYDILELPPGVAMPADVDRSKIGSGLYVPTQIAADLHFTNGTPLRLEASGIHPGREVVDVKVMFPDNTVVTFAKRESSVRSTRGGLIAAVRTDYPWPAFEAQMANFLQAATGNPDGRAVTYNEAVATLAVADAVMNEIQPVEQPLFVAERVR